METNPAIDAVLATRVDPLDNQPETILKYFRFDHLQGGLREISRQFAQMAATIVLMCPRSPERTVALRKLLEGKDAAVRSALP
jgi:hypothetical protein